MAIQNPFPPNPSLGQFYIAGRGVNGQQLFSGGNQAAVAAAMTAGVPTAYTGGLVLANAGAGTKNLYLQNAKAAFVVAQTNAAVISLGVGYSATPLAGTLTVVPSTPGNPASTATAQGILYSSATITLPVAPYLARIIGAVDTGALTTGAASPALSIDLQGSIVIPPGGYVVFLSSASGTASSFFGSLTWVEA